MSKLSFDVKKAYDTIQQRINPLTLEKVFKQLQITLYNFNCTVEIEKDILRQCHVIYARNRTTGAMTGCHIHKFKEGDHTYLQYLQTHLARELLRGML